MNLRDVETPHGAGFSQGVFHLLEGLFGKCAQGKQYAPQKVSTLQGTTFPFKGGKGGVV